MSKVEQLTFTAFRGATTSTTFHFDRTQSIILIFGENGSGKSTIADAIDFVCNQSLGSVRMRSGTKPNHIIAAEAKASDLNVKLVFDGKSWDAFLRSNKPVSIPADAPKAFVLRRADITRIMESTDSDRYKALQSFITVPKIEVAEGSLRSLYKNVANEVERETAQRVGAEETLQNYWIEEGKPQNDPFTWARSVVKEPLEQLHQQKATDEKLLAQLSEAVSSIKRLHAAQEKVHQEATNVASFEQQMQQLSQQQSNADLILTLNAVEKYLQTHPEVDRCPVCLRPEPEQPLLQTVQEQLHKLRDVQQLQQQLQQAHKAVDRAHGEEEAARQALRTAYATLLKTLRDLLPELLAITQVDLDCDDETNMVAKIEQIAKQRDVFEKRLENAHKKLNQYNALKTHLETIDRHTSESVDKHALSQRLHTWLAIIEEERKHFVQQKVDQISDTVDQLYARIHPDEALGKPSFRLKPNVKGSLTLTSSFGSADDIPPAAYYSEAHLDTLGLCVYLALAKETGNALVVLDDVLMSVDDPHLDRIVELINEEAENFGHVIITTHSRAWFDRMRMGQGMKAQLIELFGWSIDGGIKHSRSPLAVAELRAAVGASKLDRQSVASRAGILLEQLLDELTLRYSCRLPRKRTAEYTLGELVDGVDKKLRKLLRTEHVNDTDTIVSTFELSQLLDNCSQDTWIRNQVGAHFNPKAAGISDAMVRQFGERVLGLADALLCAECGQLPRQNKSGSYFQCGGGCGKTRLYPLQAP